MLSFGPSDEQDALAASITILLERHRGHQPTRQLWEALGAVGLLGVGSREVGGGATDLVAGMRAAGRAAARGPFLGAVLACRTDDPELAARSAAGASMVGLVAEGIAGWGGIADVLLELSADGSLWLVEPEPDVRDMHTLAEEHWTCGSFRRVAPLGVVSQAALAAVDLARSAWIVGASEALVTLAADHARVRHQFGRPIGDFQGVAHPLAAAIAEAGAAGDLVQLAAWRLDHDIDPVPAAMARLAATRAGLQAAYASHQAHGAIGFTVERGLHRWSTGIRQLSLHPPTQSRTVEVLLG